MCRFHFLSKLDFSVRKYDSFFFYIFYSLVSNVEGLAYRIKNIIYLTFYRDYVFNLCIDSKDLIFYLIHWFKIRYISICNIMSSQIFCIDNLNTRTF